MAMAVLAVLSLPALAATGVQAATSNWTVEEDSLSVTFEPGDGNSLTRDVTVVNTDQNNSVDLSTSIGGGHDVEAGPTLGPGESASITVTLNAGGDGSATLTISGGGKSVDVPVTVETPAYVEISGLPDWMDDEGVLTGNTRTAEITVEEVGGYSGFSGIDVGSGSNVDLSNLRQTSLSAGGQTTVQVSFTAPSGAEQHADIGGTFSLEPQNDGGAATSSVTLETWVAYPPSFGDVHLTDHDFVFDEPKSVGQIAKSTEVEITNGGDRPLDVGSLSLSSTAFEQVRVESVPNTIPGGESRNAEVTVVASTSLGEGTYDVSGTVTSSNYGVDAASVTDQLEVVHQVDLGASTGHVRLGDVPIGQRRSGTVTIAETLGYESISGLEMTMTDGPDSWLSVSSGPPDTLPGGTSATVRYRVNFDPSADIGTTYRWRFEIAGDAGGRETVVVSATPIPLNLNPIQQSLSQYTGGGGASAAMASSTLDVVKTLDQGIRDGTVPKRDISTVLTLSDGVIRFIEATRQANEHLQANEHSAAQEAIVKAAVAYDTMRTYADTIRNDELAAMADPIVERADKRLDALIDRQRSYYKQRLNSEDTSLLQKAAIKREMALMATLQGDDQRAKRLNREADAAFERYSEAVARGEKARQRAATIWQEMRSDQFTAMVLGQPVLLNPTAYESFQDRTDALLAAYDEAEAAFREAGETSQANAVAATRARRASQLTIARYTLFGSIAATFLLAFGLVIWTGRGMYQYVQDSREAVSGDFLV